MTFDSEHILRLLDLTNQIEKVAKSNNFDPPTTALKVKSLKLDFPPEFINRALEIVFARHKALRLGEWVKDALLTKQSSEQATRPQIASYHAARFSGCNHILEIGTGIGMDTAALAAVSKKVTSVESDPELSEMAKHNLKIRGIKNVEVLTGKVEEVIQDLSLKDFDGLWADPSRRLEDGKRTRDANQYQPALDFVMNLECGKIRGIKISPVTDIEDQHSGWKREVIGFEDECLEQVLWYGGSGVEVVLVDVNERVDSNAEMNPEIWSDELPPFLIEPHAALIRGHAVGSFYAEKKFFLLDDNNVLGVSVEKPKNRPWYSVFEVIESAALDIKSLKKRVKELNWNNRTEIKKRGLELSPEELRRDLKMPAPSAEIADFGVIFVTTINNKPKVFFAKRLS